MTVEHFAQVFVGKRCQKFFKPTGFQRFGKGKILLRLLGLQAATANRMGQRLRLRQLLHCAVSPQALGQLCRRHIGLALTANHILCQCEVKDIHCIPDIVAYMDHILALFQHKGCLTNFAQVVEGRKLPNIEVQLKDCFLLRLQLPCFSKGTQHLFRLAQFALGCFQIDLHHLFAGEAAGILYADLQLDGVLFQHSGKGADMEGSIAQTKAKGIGGLLRRKCLKVPVAYENILCVVYIIFPLCIARSGRMIVQRVCKGMLQVSRGVCLTQQQSGQRLAGNAAPVQGIQHRAHIGIILILRNRHAAAGIENHHHIGKILCQSIQQCLLLIP